MKTTMKVFALISLIMIALASVFKVMHWPGASIMFLLGFAMLAFVFYPSAISVMRREYKIKWGGLIYPVALIGGIALMIGILFKLLHYPGASYLLLTGFVLFIFVLIPSIVISKISTTESKFIRRTNIIGAASMAVILVGLCSKFFHWPGAAAELFVGSLALSLVWLPLYTYYAFRESTFVKGGFIYLCTAIIFFNLFNMLLALNVSRVVYKDFVQPSITLTSGTDSFMTYNTSLINAAAADSTTNITLVNKVNTIHQRAKELITYIKSVKTSLVALLDEIPESEARSMSDDYYLLQNKFDADIPTKYFCGKNENDGVGYNIQIKIEAYRNLLLAEADKDPTQTEFIKKLLSTTPVSMEESEDVSWVMYYFNSIPAIGVLNTLSGLEFKVALAENSMIRHLTELQNETKQ